ncbi:histidine-type phosphatase [Chitinophaga filiformis]|uniref:Multiple inositol polyphosphate phosphatase 1 n=1 Tax=Chitinophaga filiformis TaxID=104663 RepID=A0A1G7SPJ2_CHIFI|nr:histidine-type phosphatase [Chitinophaga filiformis]SDG24851.1 Histidine phosphatase superfamily (branch 2) [Chitinophaga filiformis]
MHYRNSLLVILSLAFFSCAHAQEKKFLGTKTPYPFKAVRYTPPPGGFTPVFVNYVGRHGARFLTKAGADIKVQALLQQAQQSAALTPVGVQLLAMTNRFLTIEQNNYENISQLGAAEQAGIGERILKNNGPAFKGRGLDVEVTHKVRTRQSATAFLSAFKNYSGDKTIHAAPADTAENVLRFYDLSPAYTTFKDGPVVTGRADSLEQDARTASVAQAVWKKVFKPSFALQEEKALTFTKSLYDLYSVQFSIPLEIKAKGYQHDSINFGIAFDASSLAWMSFINDAEDFYEKGPGLDTLGIQVTVAVPLLADFLNSTAAAINGNLQKDAVLRFTHAEAISPFATLLGIPAASHPTASVYRYAQHWQASGIIPLSANIQWIVYSNGKDYLVKVLLNEREVQLPVKTAHYPYYKWEDVQQYYADKLHKIGTTPDADMHRYLLELK